ncbi:unnamed protein product, partial [Amoebophrya sp. A25]|eukprot:GSA25T00026963001.1
MQTQALDRSKGTLVLGEDAFQRRLVSDEDRRLLFFAKMYFLWHDDVEERRAERITTSQMARITPESLHDHEEARGLSERSMVTRTAKSGELFSAMPKREIDTTLVVFLTHRPEDFVIENLVPDDKLPLTSRPSPEFDMLRAIRRVFLGWRQRFKSILFVVDKEVRVPSAREFTLVG